MSDSFSAIDRSEPEVFRARVTRIVRTNDEEHPSQQFPRVQEECDRLEARRVLQAVVVAETKRDQRHTVTWLPMFADRYLGGCLPEHINTITTPAGNVVWRFWGKCAVCGNPHSPDARGNGRPWTIAWDTRSTNCVVTCLKTGQRKFLQHPDY